MLESLGEKSTAAERRVALAQLAIEEGHPEDAEKLVLQAREEFRSENLADEQVSVQAALARAFLAEGKLAEAQKEIDAAGPPAAKIQRRSLRLDLGITSARVLAALGKTTDARTGLNKALNEARRAGFVKYQLEARLAQGEIEFRSGNRDLARRLWSEVERQARARRFLLIARQAAAAGPA